VKRQYALQIGNYLVNRLTPFCLPGRCVIAGGTRRGKVDVHDLEIVCEPDMNQRVRPIFGVRRDWMPAHRLGMELIDLETQDFLFFKQGQDKNRKYWINLAKFGLPESEGFMLDLFIVTPPAQFGVQLVIRTGPGSDDDNFSKWIVTTQAMGGALPNGYCVKNGAVWFADQIGEKGNPKNGEKPLSMPTEESFLDFLGITAEPMDRHALWSSRQSIKNAQVQR
jgi:hypothetical protein